MRLPALLSKLIRFGRYAAPLGGVALLSGCSWLVMNGHQSTIDVEGPVARDQLKLFYLTCWVTLVIFILVGSVLAYATVKFKARTPTDERPKTPSDGHGNPFIEMGLIGASIFALVIIAIPTLKSILYTNDVPAELKADAYQVTATGYQWWFKFDYPTEQIAGFGALTTGDELVIPAGRPVHVDLRSVDVMHSFWVPKLAGKVDMIPNRANYLWLQADHPGYYWGQCAEYCGESHAVMRFRVIALGPKEFEEWLDNQTQPARSVAAPAAGASAKPKAQFAALREFSQNESGTSGAYEVAPLDAWRAKQFVEKGEDPVLIARGKALFVGKTCASCHTIRGVPGAVGIQGPDLTHVGARSTLAGSWLDNTPEQLQRWIHNPGAVKPGNKMWVNGYIVNNIKLTPEDETALVAYIQSLK